MGVEFIKGTGRESDKFMLRLPDGMRERIAESAKANNRSMNAEIVARLEGSFQPADDSRVVIDQARQIFDLRRELALVHMGMVMPRMYVQEHAYREEAIRDINQAMSRTGPHAQWLMDLSLDELNALRVQMGYAPLKAEEFTGIYKTAAQRDAAKAADAAYFATNPDG